MTEKIRILIADDHNVVRAGLKTFFMSSPDIEIIGEAGNGLEAVEQALALRPNIILMDLLMPGLDGIEATRRICQEIPGSRILIITSFAEDERVVSAIQAGAMGYLLKDAIETLFKTPLLQASIRLFSAAILLTLAERFTRKNRGLDSMTWLDALVVGLFQIIAVFPGASRSGSTISGGMFRGLDRPAAARFAFLMSVPVMLAAGGYEMLDVIQMPNLGAFLPALAVGFIAAAITGWLAIRWLIAYLSQRSLYLFAGYCAILGTAVSLFHFLSK